MGVCQDGAWRRKMRITECVHVSRGARHVCGHVHQANSLRRLNAPRFADLEFRVSRVLKKWRQPAQLKFRPAIDQDIGVAQGYDKAWSRINKVRILRRFRQNGYIDFVAADFPSERSEVRQRRNHVQFGRCCESACDNCWQE